MWKIILAFTLVLGISLGSRELILFTHRIKFTKSKFPAVPEIFETDRIGITEFITGGTATQISNHPFMASLRTLSNFHFCGGVILNNVSFERAHTNHPDFY
jgi:hypothetical protein